LRTLSALRHLRFAYELTDGRLSLSLQDYQKKIKNKSAKANEVFSACDVFLNDTPKVYCAFDSLRATYDNLQRRWDNICEQSQDRLNETDTLWKDWKSFDDDYARLHTWVKEKAVEVSSVDVEASKVPSEELGTLETELEGVRDAMAAKLADLDAFNDAYCDLAREYRLDGNDELKGKFIAVNRDWEALGADVEALLRRIRHSRQLFDNFTSLREREMDWLRSVDARLANVEFADADDEDADGKRDDLRRLRAEMTGRERSLERVSESSLHLVQRSELRDAERVEEMAQEFADLRGDVAARLRALAERMDLDAEDEVGDETDRTIGEEVPLPPVSVSSSIQVS